MSMYHTLGIDEDGKLHAITHGESKDSVLTVTLEHAPRYRQLFLVKSGQNARELVFTPPSEGKLEEGDYAPVVQKEF